MRIYVAGPMTGLPEFNYPAFFAAADALRVRGHDPINPARGEGREGCKTWLDFMRAGIRDVAACDGVALLPGWHDSRGAALEAHIARSLGLPVRTFDEWLAEDVTRDLALSLAVMAIFVVGWLGMAVANGWPH